MTGKVYPPERNRFYGFMQALIVGFNRLYFRLETIGAENTPLSGPVLLVANHASNLDPTTIACQLPRQCHFLAKEELFKGPLGKFLRKVNSHPINRSGVDRAALKLCVDILKDGHMLMMFPEGTRSPDGELQEAKAGAPMMALQAGAVVLPAYIDGSLDAMPRGVNLPRPRKIRVFVGKPFPCDEGLDTSLPKREQYEILGRKMMDHIRELRIEAHR